ncbi:hypothetical protein ACN38_g11422, partial [Penicillium nordicum]
KTLRRTSKKEDLVRCQCMLLQEGGDKIGRKALLVLMKELCDGDPYSSP